MSALHHQTLALRSEYSCKDQSLTTDIIQVTAVVYCADPPIQQAFVPYHTEPDTAPSVGAFTGIPVVCTSALP